MQMEASAVTNVKEYESKIKKNLRNYYFTDVIQGRRSKHTMQTKDWLFSILSELTCRVSQKNKEECGPQELCAVFRAV